MSEPLLSVEDVYAGYASGIDILQGISLAVAPGSLTLIVGPNGAGKSTLLKVLFGFLQSHRGKIRFRATRIDGLEPHEVKSLGVGYVPQEINTFPLRIAHSESKNLFNLRDFRGAATAIEKLLDEFDNVSAYWEQIHISKSSLQKDAAVAWLHYADSLSSTREPDQQENRCRSYERALATANQAMWPDFRQKHVPILQQRLTSCLQNLKRL